MTDVAVTSPEPIVVITADGRTLDPEWCGAKAVGLQRLLRVGLAVPPAAVIPVAHAPAIAAGDDDAALADALAAVADPDQRVAVRSGAAVSLPGAMDTVLDVAAEVGEVRQAIAAVVASASGERARTVARTLGHETPPPTAVIVQRMVDTVSGPDSGAGAATSRHPVTGRPGGCGSFAWRMRGDAVMAGTVPVHGLGALADRLPVVHEWLQADLHRLEAGVDGPVEVEFAVEAGRLWYLQLRPIEVVPVPGALPEDAVVIADGVAASGGIGRGRLHVDVDDALDAADRGEAVVLALETTSPGDVAAMVASAAVITVLGSRESHAAVVTRGARVPAVVGVRGLLIAVDHIELGGRRIDIGTEVLVDGTTGTIAVPGADDADERLGLAEAYAVETPDDNRRLYASWASTYEAGFTVATGYEYHEHVADVFVAGPVAAGPVLDVGCGTGIVGEALARRGIELVDGIDISPEMLREAGTKGIYGALIEADLIAGTALPDNTYAGVVSAGTFTHGHLPPEVLGELVRIAAPGARFAIGVNAAHWTEHGFAAWLDAAVTDDRIEPYEIVVVKIYAGSDPDDPDDMANIVSFRVR